MTWRRYTLKERAAWAVAVVAMSLTAHVHRAVRVIRGRR